MSKSSATIPIKLFHELIAELFAFLSYAIIAALLILQIHTGCDAAKAKVVLCDSSGEKIHTHCPYVTPYTACSDHKALVCFPILWLSGLIFILIERQVTS